MARKKKEAGEILPPPHALSVKEYEKSPYWIAKSKALLDDKTCTCAICGRKRWKWLSRKKDWKRSLRFSVHHITYKNCPNEKREDLLTLCSLCHTYCHEALRYRQISEMYAKVASIVEEYFKYDGIDTFNVW